MAEECHQGIIVTWISVFSSVNELSVLFLKMCCRNLLATSTDKLLIYPVFYLIVKCLFWLSEHPFFTSIENMSKEYCNLLSNFYSDPHPITYTFEFSVKASVHICFIEWNDSLEKNLTPTQKKEVCWKDSIIMLCYLKVLITES